MKVVEDFHDHPGYVKAIARSVNEYWMKHGRPDRLVMSFHGLPQRGGRGAAIRTSASAARARASSRPSWAGTTRRTLVTFQSRFGAQEWLKPYTDETLAALGREGVGRVDVICPGFAADCLETLEEIAHGRPARVPQGGRQGFPLHPYHERHARLDDRPHHRSPLENLS